MSRVLDTKFTPILLYPAMGTNVRVTSVTSVSNQINRPNRIDNRQDMSANE